MARAGRPAKAHVAASRCGGTRSGQVECQNDRITGRAACPNGWGHMSRWVGDICPARGRQLWLKGEAKFSLK